MLPAKGKQMMIKPKIFLNIPDSEFPNRVKNVLSGVRYAHFEGLLHNYNLQNRG